MASLTQYARASDDVSPNATWSVIAGAANAAYPVGNLGNRNPARPFKATGVSVTARATFGVAQVLVGIAIPNHNLAGATSVVLTSGAGLNQTVIIPANTADGQCTNAFLDFSAATLAQRTSTTFDLAVTGGVLGNIAIGEVLLLTALRDLRWIWGLTFTLDRLMVRHQTFGGSRLQYDKRIRMRGASGRTQLETHEADIRLLEEGAKGPIVPWLLVPKRTVNDCWYVQFVSSEFSWIPQSIGGTDIPVVIEEVSMGPPLF